MLTLLQERVWDFVIRVFNFKITLKIRSIRNEKFEIRIICNDQTPNTTQYQLGGYFFNKRNTFIFD